MACIGLANKFLQVFPYDVTEGLNELFGQLNICAINGVNTYRITVVDT